MVDDVLFINLVVNQKIPKNGSDLNGGAEILRSPWMCHCEMLLLKIGLDSIPEVDLQFICHFFDLLI